MVEEDLFAKVAALAKTEGRSTSNMIAHLIERGLNGLGREPEAGSIPHSPVSEPSADGIRTKAPSRPKTFKPDWKGGKAPR